MSDVTDIAKSGTAGMTPAQRKQFETVHSLLLPINKELLLLPNAAVAEVITYSEPEAINDAPEWLLGILNWRERRIPLISFESISDGESGPDIKIVVLFFGSGTGKADQRQLIGLEFYMIVPAD